MPSRINMGPDGGPYIAINENSGNIELEDNTGTTVAIWDDTNSQWDFQNNPISNVDSLTSNSLNTETLRNEITQTPDVGNAESDLRVEFIGSRKSTIGATSVSDAFLDSNSHVYDTDLNQYELLYVRFVYTTAGSGTNHIGARFNDNSDSNYDTSIASSNSYWQLSTNLFFGGVAEGYLPSNVSDQSGNTWFNAPDEYVTEIQHTGDSALPITKLNLTMVGSAFSPHTEVWGVTFE